MRLKFRGTTYEVKMAGDRPSRLTSIPRSFRDVGNPEKHELPHCYTGVRVYEDEHPIGYKYWVGFVRLNSQWPEYWPLSLFTEVRVPEL
jgi:hypothetical protein